jgi:uroporphyrinogen III methyltransferase/synthase
MTTGALAGRTILVTRAAAQAGELLDAIRDRGGDALLFPMIEIAPPSSWAGCDAAIAKLSGYDGILFASANGVEGFFHRLASGGVGAEKLRGKALYAVGQRTKDAVERHGLPVHPVPERFTAADLLAAMGDAQVQGKSFLFPRGNLGSPLLADGLVSRGALVETVEVYRTVEPDRCDLQAITGRLREGRVDAAMFASPSAAKHFAALFTAEELQAIARRTAIAAIGPATAAALAELGIPANVTAPQSTMASLLDAVEAYIAQH